MNFALQLSVPTVAIFTTTVTQIALIIKLSQTKPIHDEGNIQKQLLKLALVIVRNNISTVQEIMSRL